jgi:hypothetical protein
MGGEMFSPGARAPGLTHVTAAAARAWAMAAAQAAVRVPAANAEAAAWTVRGWADVAVGCLALPGPAAFGGLDEVIRSVPVASGGPQAARLRSLRRLAGPVPAWYPDTSPVEGPIRRVSPRAWRAAGLIARFGELLMTTAAELPPGLACPLSSARQLAWGARYRPLPSDEHVAVHLPVSRRLARRTWMCLPGLPGPGTALAEVPSTATPLAQQIWRGIHEGAHLDHLAALSRLGGPGPTAPSPAEFGAGLMVTESYAMAVEIVAAVECTLAGEGQAVWQLGAGLIERATRLPGASHPALEFADLPTLAEVYVLGPLEILAGGTASRVLPEEVTGTLHTRWLAATAAYPAAAAFASAAGELVSRSAFSSDEDAEPDLNRRKLCIHRHPLSSYIKLTSMLMGLREGSACEEPTDLRRPPVGGAKLLIPAKTRPSG